MASKTISLEESAYNLLLRAKRGDESFSKVVQRLLQPKDDPLGRMVGLLSAAEGKRMRDLLDEQRRLDRAATMERYKRLGLV